VCAQEDDEVLGLAFEMFDTDNSGSIDQAEYAAMIRVMLKSLGDQEPVRFLVQGRSSVNQVGAIDAAELARR
jgi:Ca2+-binding EF-hand superfamily protein